jgi:DNA-directed RNA polymerase subunit RPC12/RpoP
MARYRCNHCGKVVERDDWRKWFMSFCEDTQKMTRLWRLRDVA